MCAVALPLVYISLIVPHPLPRLLPCSFCHLSILIPLPFCRPSQIYTIKPGNFSGQKEKVDGSYFEILKVLGTGSFGKVLLVRKTKGKKSVIGRCTSALK